MHRARNGAQVCVQVCVQAQAGAARRRVGQAPGDHHPTAPQRAAQDGGVQGRLRGHRHRAPRHGALHRRQALRPHHGQGQLLRAPGRRRLPRRPHRRPRLPLHGGHAPRPQARELPARQPRR